MDTREREQVLDDLLAAHGGAVDPIEFARHRPLAVTRHQQLREAEHAAQRVVEFVSHAGDHLADARQLLRLQQLELRRPQLGHVPSDPDRTDDVTVAIGQRCHVQLEIQFRAVGLAEAHGVVRDPAAVADLVDPRRTIGSEERLARTPDHFFARPAGQTGRAAIELGDATVRVGGDDKIG